MSIKLYRHPLSGHSHRVEVLLSILGLDAEVIDVDLASGDHKSQEFLSKNIFGQLPVLEDGEVTLADSNAILVYLANRYDSSGTWLPKHSVDLAEVQRFLSVAAGPIASGPATARLVTVFGSGHDQNKAIEVAHSVLAVLDQHLEGRSWLATNLPTIADIANYAYIAHAPEGEVDLVSYPNVRQWLRDVEALANFKPMQATPVGLAA